MKQIWQTIEQFHMLEEGDRVLLGVSGGPDSMALLHFLNSQKERYGIRLYVAHINHKLRPEAQEEAAYVKRICEAMEIPFRLFECDVADYAQQKHMSIEQAGHEVRHRCFQEAAEAWRITKLALGHHADDRAESVLLHLVQGCGLDGLTAMPPKDGWLIRPLAQIKKQELIAYCERHQLHYFTDGTNLQPHCLRNKIRLELLPELGRYNSRITDALLRLLESGGADAEYLEQCTERLWNQYGTEKHGSICFPADELRRQHIAMQRRLLRYLYRKLTGSEANLTFQQTEQMREIAVQNHGTKQLSLAGGVVFIRRYDWLCVAVQQEQKEDYCYEWDLYTELNIGEGRYIFSATETDIPEAERCGDDRHQNFMQIYADAGKLTMPLTIRNRRPGDVLKMPYGHKKLKDFYIDQKIPADWRGQLPVVLSGETIIWIPGYYKAECIRVTGETRQICRLSCNSSIFL